MWRTRRIRCRNEPRICITTVHHEARAAREVPTPGSAPIRATTAARRSRQTRPRLARWFYRPSSTQYQEHTLQHVTHCIRLCCKVVHQLVGPDTGFSYPIGSTHRRQSAERCTRFPFGVEFHSAAQNVCSLRAQATFKQAHQAQASRHCMHS